MAGTINNAPEYGLLVAIFEQARADYIKAKITIDRINRGVLPESKRERAEALLYDCKRFFMWCRSDWEGILRSLDNDAEIIQREFGDERRIRKEDYLTVNR